MSGLGSGGTKKGIYPLINQVWVFAIYTCFARISNFNNDKKHLAKALYINAYKYIIEPVIILNIYSNGFIMIWALNYCFG